MNWKKQISSLFLALTLTASLIVPAIAVEATTSEDTQTTQTETTTDSNTEQTDTNTTDAASDGSPSDSASTDNASKQKTSDTAADKADSTTDSTQQDDLDPSISLSAKASICVNAETGAIVEEKNARKKMYPASTTKIMTALLVLENCKDLSETVTMEAEDFKDVEGGASTAGFKEGETVTVESLLYGLMLPSGNEAANALARYIGRDVASFVKMMNSEAKSLGCVNTHLVNTNGLHDDNHYTCAYDLYLIAKAAMKYDTFQTIVNTAQKKLPATSMNPERIIYTTNELIFSRYSPMYYANCYGIKTGHTTPAGYCFVSYAKNDSVGLSYYSVVMGCDFDNSAGYAGSFVQTKKLLEWAYSSFSMKTATAAQEAVTECPVRLGKDKDSVTLVTDQDVKVLLPRSADASMLDVSIDTQDSYDAPIAKGDKLGTVTYSYHGQKLASADLVALTGVERSQILYFLDQLKKFICTPIFAVLVILIVVIAVVLTRVRAANRKKRRKNLRQSKPQKKNKP